MTAGALALPLAAFLCAGTPPGNLLTVAESSDWRATARHAEVIELLERLDERSPLVHVTEIGRTHEGLAIPLAILADPPVATAHEAIASGKPIVLAFANIHAGEVCGKEALPILARELTDEPRDPAYAALLRDLVVLFVPILNGDGNEQVALDNRPGQLGPEAGMGVRHNAQGFDLNRDWTKLESPEIRAMVRLLSEWDPHVVIDTHTTNGSHHRYVVTWDAPLSPEAPAASVAFLRDELLPDVSRRLEERDGYALFAYGNFDDAHRTWSAYSALPRYGANYHGVRGTMSILSEAYAYAPYRDRVLATRAFVLEILRYAAEHGERIIELHRNAREATVAAGASHQPDDVVGLRWRIAAFPEAAAVRGWEMTSDADGKPVPTDVPRDYTVVHLGRFERTVSVRRPLGYVIEPGCERVLDNLSAHGIEWSPFEGDALVEAYTVTGVRRAEVPFQGHNLADIDVRAQTIDRSYARGSALVRTAQPLGTLAVLLLEPRSEDGLGAWEFFDEIAGTGPLAEGRLFPVARLVAEPDRDAPRGQ